MDVKEYLEQAIWLDQSIKSKLESRKSLYDLSTNMSSPISDMPRGGNRNIHKMENAVVNLTDMEAEIIAEINELVDIKKNIKRMIKSVDNPEYRLLLELRYQNGKTWEQIAVNMGYRVRHIYRLCDHAIAILNKKENENNKKRNREIEI